MEVITFESKPTSNDMDKILFDHFKGLGPNEACMVLVKTNYTNYLSYVKRRDFIWTIQVRVGKKNLYLSSKTGTWIGRSDFLDWIKEDHPDSLEWLLFNPEWLEQ